MRLEVGRLHCNYRVLGTEPRARQIAERLDRLAAGEMPGALERALDRALEGDPAVYVLRRVEDRFAVRIAEDLPEGEVARRWGESLAGAVLRALRSGDGVRFASPAELVARFAVDLLAGRAAGLWYYRPFVHLEGKPPREFLQAALREHREHLEEILRELHRRSALTGVLELLGREAAAELWRELTPAEPDRQDGPTAEEARSLLALAASLLADLGLLEPQGGEPRVEDLVPAWQEARPRPADWRDTRSLAIALADAVRFLLRDGPAPAAAGWSRELIAARLDTALAGFDWLDKAWLRAWLHDELPAMLSPGRSADRPRADGEMAAAPASPTAPPRPPDAGPTPRQRELLADLREALSAAGLDGLRDARGLEAALRLWAALTARFPRWSGDAGARGLVETLVEAWVELRERGLPFAELRRAAGFRTGRALQNAAALGDPAVQVLETLEAMVAGQLLSPGEAFPAPGHPEALAQGVHPRPPDAGRAAQAHERHSERSEESGWAELSIPQILRFAQDDGALNSEDDNEA